jgi:hypothetical protein|tara:strand:- start:885 stop:1799 length:915 start_codon:yes stop_codon:yes gene_type:complete
MKNGGVNGDPPKTSLSDNLRSELRENYSLPLLPEDDYPEYSYEDLLPLFSPSQKKIADWLIARKETGRFEDQLGGGNLERQLLNLASNKTFQSQKELVDEVFDFYDELGYMTTSTGEKETPYETKDELYREVQGAAGIYFPEAHAMYDTKTASGEDYGGALEKINSGVDRSFQRLAAFIEGKKKDSTQKHENVHSLNAKLAEGVIEDIRPPEHEYYDDNRELYSRTMQFRLDNELDPKKIFTKEDLKDLNSERSKYMLDYIPDEQFLKLLNDVAYAEPNNDTHEAIQYGFKGTKIKNHFKVLKK